MAKEKEKEYTVPRHVAIIMDGNGRWAKKRLLPRKAGHVQGSRVAEQICEDAYNLGIEYLTIYAFSTENWARPKDEVDALMNLVVVAIEQQTPDLIKNNVRLTAIGDLERMPQFARERLNKCMSDTSHCTGLVLCLALSYSARWEIVEATRKLAQRAVNGELNPDDINDEIFASALATSHMPDPDLLIRTAGDERISNFLLWQIAYSELYFTPKFWPDFTKEDFCEAIVHYQQRERRFGTTSEQIN